MNINIWKIKPRIKYCGEFCGWEARVEWDVLRKNCSFYGSGSTPASALEGLLIVIGDHFLRNPVDEIETHL